MGNYSGFYITGFSEEGEGLEGTREALRFHRIVHQLRLVRWHDLVLEGGYGFRV